VQACGNGSAAAHADPRVRDALSRCRSTALRCPAGGNTSATARRR
jgi:hypothetical protein